MDIRKLKRDAAEILEGASYSPTRLAGIHAAVAMGISLVLTAVSYFLGNMDGGAGGIGGLGAQAALSTAQSVLQLVSALVMPFWSAGLVFCALGYARGRETEPRQLTAGFRKIGPILSSELMMSLRYLGLGLLSAFAAAYLLMLTPAAELLTEATGGLMMESAEDLQLLLGASMSQVMVWYFVIFLLLFGVLALPWFYCYRLVDYIIMDDARVGGLQAMLMSRIMTARHRLQLLKLDLSFWWFYGLELLVGLIAYGELLLPMLGVALPEGLSFWGSALVSMGCRVALYAWAKPKLMVTYALAYEQLRRIPEPEEKAPKPHPWED